MFTKDSVMAQPQVLPKELRLTASPTMPQARSYLFKQKSTLPKYTSHQTIQINIPRLQRTYLSKDSYLKFNVDLALTTGGFGWKTAATPTPVQIAANVPALSVALDTCGAFGIIDKIEVYDYLGSTLLESISGHGQLMSLLLDTSHSGDAFDSVDSCTTGVAPRIASLDSGSSYPYGDDHTQRLIGAPYGLPIIPIPTPNSKANWTKAQTVSREFAIPLTSFLGVLSSKYAPLHNGYTIQLTLNDFNLAFGCNKIADPDADGAPGFESAEKNISVSEVYFCAQALELGPTAESMLLSSTSGQPMIVPSRAYRNFNGIIDANASSYRLDLNLNVASMTSLLWMMRTNEQYTKSEAVSLGQRIRNFLQTWNFQYGSSILPQTSGIQAYGSKGNSAGASAFTEAYIELMKARRNWVGSKSSGSNITMESFYKDTDAVSNLFPYPRNIVSDDSEASKFAAGICLELVSGKDIICGLNTNGMNTSINMIFRDTDTDKGIAVQQARIDAWCEYDSFINISPGLATTVSF